MKASLTGWVASASLVLVVMFAVAGPGGPGASGARSDRTRGPQAGPKTHPVAPPFSAGETLTYGVSWSNVLRAGTATLRVAERRVGEGGREVYYLVAEAASTGWVSALHHLYYKLDTVVDAATLLPVRASSYSEEGRRRRTKSLVFDRRAGTLRYELRTATIVTRELDVPRETHDALSVLYALRTVPLAPGRRVGWPVADSGKLYRVEFAVAGRESVRTGSASVSAWRIVPTIRRADGRAESSGIVLWISDDRRRVPLRITVDLALGAFVLDLTSGV